MALRRIAAYLIDVILIFIVSSMLSSISYINPELNNYKKVYSEYSEVNKKYLDAVGDRDTEKTKELIPKLEELTYKLDKNNKYGVIIQIVLTILYFAVFQYFNHGQTLGKKLTKIKVDGDLNIFKYILRTIILHEVIFNLLRLIFVWQFSKENYILASNILYVGALLVEVTIIVMVSMRADKRGLHDLITGSSVVKI